MDLTTTYLGFRLPHPFMPGASPLADDLDTVRILEDTGAAAIVLRSLFEEQIDREQVATAAFLESPANSFAEALSYLPAPEEFALGPEEYVEQVHRIRQAVELPVVASLNGTRGGRWLDYAELIEQAGADALELNVYQLVTDPADTASTLEERILEMVRDLKKRLNIPVAVKLSAYFTALTNLVQRLAQAGADGVVLFNRFYQADIDIEELETLRTLRLSNPNELLLRLRWLAILSARLEIPLAATGGVHTTSDAVKAVMCGAQVVQLVSALLQRGPEYLGVIRQQFEQWLVEHEYESLDQMRGSMNLAHSPDPAAYERANYMQILQSWRGPT